MDKHTPGPWNNLRGSSAGYDIICSDASPVDVCVVSKRDKSREEIDANIRLITAAPDLLAALARIAAGQEMTGQFTHAETVLRYQEIARAALRKAQGGAA